MKPLRLQFAASNPFTPAPSTVLLTPTPMGGPAVGRVWDLRVVNVFRNDLTINPVPVGVVCIGNSSQAYATIAGTQAPDMRKVDDVILSFVGVPYSNHFDEFEYSISHGDELYVGLFGTALTGAVICTVQVDEYTADTVSGRRI